MDALMLDLRFAARTFVRRPAFTLVAVVTLAIAIGANGAIFSVVNGVMLKGVSGVDDARGLVEVSRDVDGQYFDMSFPVLDELSGQRTALVGLAPVASGPVSIGGAGDPEVRMNLSVTSSYFAVLRLRPSMGRFFAQDEAAFPRVMPVAVISHAFWRERFASDPGIVGRTMRVNGAVVEIIGVGPRRFRGHSVLPVDVFLPLGLDVPGLRSADELRGPENGVLEAIGRLADGVSAAAAAGALTRAADAFSRQVGGAQSGGYAVRVERWAAVPAAGRGAATALVAVLMTAVALMLAVACVNVAGMFLSRSAERGGEIALRRALGASRARVARQLLTESLLVFLAGGALGVLVSIWATRLLLTFKPPLPPGYAIELDLAPDARVIAFSLAITILALIVFNLAPALRAAQPDLSDAMRRRSGAGAWRRTRARSLLVAGQMAGAMVLLVVAGLFVRALSSLDALDPGWDADGVLAADLDLELTGTEDDAGRSFYRELTARVAALPGVESDGLAAKLPLAGSSSWGDIGVAGFEPPSGRTGFIAYLNRVSPGYFDALRIPLVMGRDFTDADDAGAAVAIVNRAMADRFWPGGNALGQRFSILRGEAREFTVVGVVENAKYRRLVEDTPNFYYLPSGRWYNAQMSLLVRTRAGASAAVGDAVARIVRQLQPDLPVQPPASLRARLDPFFLPQRVGAWVTGVIGLVGLLLGAVGVYGTTAFAVSQRTREMGVRIALGARAGEVLGMMVRQGMKAPVYGVAAGLVVAIVIARLMRGLLAEVGALDGVAFLGALATLLAAALVAAYVPARRAVRANPLESLRAE